jgi:hypothetical protein
MPAPTLMGDVADPAALSPQWNRSGQERNEHRAFLTVSLAEIDRHATTAATISGSALRREAARS